jgi:hypothetical protein
MFKEVDETWAEWEQGFITLNNDFKTREEAAKIAFERGQIMRFKIGERVSVRPELLMLCKNYLAEHEGESGIKEFPRDFIGFHLPIQMYRDIVASKGVGVISYIGEQSDLTIRRYDIRFAYVKNDYTTWTLPAFMLLPEIAPSNVNRLGNFPLTKSKKEA